MTEHRSHHRAAPEPPKRTTRDYMGIAAIVTAIGTVFAGHVTDRNSNLDQSERMHRSTLSFNAEEREELRFQIKILRQDFRDLHDYIHSKKHRAEVAAESSPVSSEPRRMPKLRHPNDPPRQRPRADPYDKLMGHVNEGRVYQGQGYPH